MAQIIKQGDQPIKPHDCQKELPGERESWLLDNVVIDLNPGTVARCSCGKLYVIQRWYGDLEWRAAGWKLRLKHRNEGKGVEA